MALLINQDCTACDACPSVCPNDAISVRAGEEPSYVIDPLRCTECVGAEDEPQCKLVCPSDCIVVHPDFVESAQELQAKYESLHS
jgi:ferredoxin